MKYLYFDAKSGLSGDMILGALLDLGVSRAEFKRRIAGLGLPVKLRIGDVERSHFRGLKVDVIVREGHSPARRWKDVAALIKRSPFPAAVKDRALRIFRNLFEAESKVHGCAFEKTHLHEAGADDAMVDVLGASWLVEELGVGAVFASPLNVGEGWVKTSHGVLPVPPPAVAELLKGVPVYSAHVQEELVTPTGAAIVKTLVERYLPFPELVYEKIGYGAGSRDTESLPNILRVFYGKAEAFAPDKRVYLIESTIDDSTPQVLAAFMERAFELGALDVFFTPIVMKKNRLASKLTLLAEPDKMDDLITAVFRETSSIGVRYYPVERRALERTVRTIRLLGEPVGIKISSLGGERLNVQPEYADCLAVARKKGLPVKEVLRKALEAYHRKS
jgi:uncharacterized protein (TIGR00299 family) protein